MARVVQIFTLICIVMFHQPGVWCCPAFGCQSPPYDHEHEAGTESFYNEGCFPSHLGKLPCTILAARACVKRTDRIHVDHVQNILVLTYAVEFTIS